MKKIKNYTYLICSPKYFRISHPINSFQKENIDNQPNSVLAIAQHSQIEKTLKDMNVVVDHIEPNEDLPYQVFTRDIIVGSVAPILVCNPKEAIRNGEKEIFKNYLKAQKIEYIELQKGCVEGGDVITFGDRLFIGIGERTNDIGFKIFKNNYKKQYEIFPIHFYPEFLHLDMVFNVIDDETCILYTEAIHEDSYKIIKNQFNEIIEIDKMEYRAMSTNFLMLPNKQVICSSTASQNVIELMENHHLNVRLVNINEIQKGGGGIRCATAPILTKANKANSADAKSRAAD